MRVKLLILVVSVIGITVCVITNVMPAQLPLNTSLNLQDLAKTFAALMAWLFAVALFAERAVEVIITVFRDQVASLLDDEEEQATHTLEKAITDASNLVKSGASSTDQSTANTVVNAARSNLADVQKRKTIYRSKTKEIAMMLSFVLGILISCAGVHMLNGILSKEGMDKTNALFNILDIFITGLMIAGGSEGIHRMANAFTSTMDNISTRADQAQKKPPTT